MLGQLQYMTHYKQIPIKIKCLSSLIRLIIVPGSLSGIKVDTSASFLEEVYKPSDSGNDVEIEWREVPGFNATSRDDDKSHFPQSSNNIDAVEDNNIGSESSASLKHAHGRGVSVVRMAPADDTDWDAVFIPGGNRYRRVVASGRRVERDDLGSRECRSRAGPDPPAEEGGSGGGGFDPVASERFCGYDGIQRPR